MIIELFVLLQIMALVLFFISFFTEQEILWAIAIVLFGVLSFTSFNVEYSTYEYNVTLYAYQPVVQTFSYPYLMGINILFFSVSLLLFTRDTYYKYWKKL
jgi:hypothetical protein